MSGLDPSAPTSPWYWTGLRRGLGHHSAHHRALAQQGVIVERLAFDGPFEVDPEDFVIGETALIPSAPTATIAVPSLISDVAIGAEVLLEDVETNFEVRAVVFDDGEQGPTGQGLIKDAGTAEELPGGEFIVINSWGMVSGEWSVPLVRNLGGGITTAGEVTLGFGIRIDDEGASGQVRNLRAAFPHCLLSL